jgi:hypothetical protein
MAFHNSNGSLPLTSHASTSPAKPLPIRDIVTDNLTQPLLVPIAVLMHSNLGESISALSRGKNLNIRLVGPGMNTGC